MGGFCSSQLQLNCNDSICDQLDSFPDSRPYLTGAAPSGGSLFVDGFESGNLSAWSTPGSGSGNNNAGSQPGNIQTINLPEAVVMMPSLLAVAIWRQFVPQRMPLLLMPVYAWMRNVRLSIVQRPVDYYRA